MEEIRHHHHHHHHHHGHSPANENEGQQNATIVENTVTSVGTERQGQPNLAVPLGVPNTYANQTFGGVQATGSFNSVSSGDSIAEMANYFPEAETRNLQPFRYPEAVEGQVETTTTSNTVVTSNIGVVNAGPYIPVSAPTTVQQLPQPVRVPFMAQQQRQPIRLPGQPQIPLGIPSYPSQIEGLSVSQAVVNDVLVDLQSKVINESLQQYQNESSGGAYLEPLPPIYIQAPQPTIILRSDLHRLRAELNSRVRPPVIYRNPAGVNQFQQHQFQQNTFQAPRFPVPPQHYNPQGYHGQYQNPIFTTSDKYKTTTPDVKHRKEEEERLYNQAESPTFNDDNINDNIQNAFDLQGLTSTASDRHASPYQFSSSFLPNLEVQQQGNEETALTSSQHINDEEIGRTDNMFSRPDRPRQEMSFDIDNCIFRCFEAHRQGVARRRAARQARRTRRHKQSPQQQQQNQQLYHTDQYQTLSTQPTFSSFGTSPQTQWEQQPPPLSSYHSDVTSGLEGASQGSYPPVSTYDYTNIVPTATLPADIQQYQSSDTVNAHASQIPFSSLSTSNIDATVPIDVQSSGGNYYQYQTIDVQEPYLSSNAFDYASHQTMSDVPDVNQQTSSKQQQQLPAQASFDYSSQVPYTPYSAGDATVPSEIQNLTSEYYQQQQIPSQLIQNQGTYVQPSNTFDYAAESAQTRVPSYDYQNIGQQSYGYPYNVENIQTEEPQTFDSSNQAVNSSDYYQQQPIHVPVPEAQGTYSQPTGTFEYTRQSYQSEDPVDDYQGVDQQSSQYSHNVRNVQQIPQQDSYNYAAPTQIEMNLAGQNQGVSSTNYYQQQPISQVPQHVTQSSDTFDYNADTTQTQMLTYDYHNVNQQSFDYTSAATTAYAPPETNIEQTEQNQNFDYSSQVLDSSNYYQQQFTPSSSAHQVQGAYSQPNGTVEYTREGYQSQKPIYNYQGANQETSQYSYNVEGIQQPQEQNVDNYTSEAATMYSTSETNVQQPTQNQTYDYSGQILSSTDRYYQQPTSIPVSQVGNSQRFAQRIPGASIPTGTVEYTRQAYYSEEPLSDNYTTETFIQQQEENQSLNVNDHLRRFVSEPSPQSAGGHLQSSDDRHSVTTVTTTPFIIQQNIDQRPAQGAPKTYDLQNYTNESIVSEISPPPLSSSFSEEDHQYLLQHSDKEISLHDTYSSLPPPPPVTTEEFDYQQESIATNTSEFPLPPPTPDRRTYQIMQQRPSRSHPSIIPSNDQTSIYTERLPLQTISPGSSSHGTDDDLQEDEENFDLRQCIANCYAKYQASWNHEERRKHAEQIQATPQPIFDATNQQFNQYQQTATSNLQPYSGTGEIHYIEGSTQTPSLDVTGQSNIVQQKYDEISSSFDTKPYIPYISIKDLSIDSQGQQTIEYSPPLITQTRHINSAGSSSVPLPSYEYSQHEEQQQQQQQQQPPIYDHTLPTPPHLSFNDTDYQPNIYFSSQITARPRQEENIPFATNEEQKQRYRAYSEPPSIQQDVITSIPSLQPSSSQIFEDQTRRSISIPMIRQQYTQPRIPPVRMLDNGRAYEAESISERRLPRIDPSTGLCLVPCPMSQKYAHLPPHLRPELICIEVPPPSALPPVPPPPPPPPPPRFIPPPPVQQQRWCVRCCCAPGRTLIKKIVYREVRDVQEQRVEPQYDYGSVINQMGTNVNVRYENNLMPEGDAFIPGNYNEQLRVVDFPVYVSGQNDPNLTPLIPHN